jgi:GT2 family glycosyltransferase
MKKPELSIVILSFNTKELLKKCLQSLKKVEDEINFEIIVPDNGSKDRSVEMLRKEFPKTKVIEIGSNLGFAAGNNRARKYCKGKYVLFLNSDTIVKKNTLKKSVKYLDRHKDIGALTCKILLPTRELDKDARRSFITPWVGLTHLILKVDRIFPKSKLFSKYWYGYIPHNRIHEVDVLQGAFFLTRKRLLDDLGWFDEEYFLDGEDIDLSWRIKQKGLKIVYYPKVSIIHYKGSAKGKVGSHTRKSISLKERLKFRMAGVNSMEIFYKKRLWNKYPLLVNFIVITGIKFMKVVRFVRTLILG